MRKYLRALNMRRLMRSTIMSYQVRPRSLKPMLHKPTTKLTQMMTHPADDARVQRLERW